MIELNIENPREINNKFCELIGMKPIKAVLLNVDTKEVKTYFSISCLYKKPKGWVNTKICILKTPLFPDFTDPINFSKLIELQWEMFGNIGDQYFRMRNESFAVNYLFSKVRAIETLLSYGGSEMLEEYIDRIYSTNFYIDLNLEDFKC